MSSSSIPYQNANPPVGLASSHHDPHHILPQKGTLRRKILDILLSRTCEVLLLFLLICDVVLVMAELEIGSKVVCKIEWADLPESPSPSPSQTPSTTTTTTTSSAPVPSTPIPTSYWFNATLCREAPAIEYTCVDQRIFNLPQPFSSCPFRVTEELPHGLQVAEDIVNWFSRIIIITFGVELSVLFCAGGPKLFWHHKLYILDAIVVAISIIFDGVATTTSVSSITELIVIARCWRFARIVHGVHEGTSKQQNHNNNNNDSTKDVDDQIETERTAADV